MFSSWTNAKNKELASVFASSFELDVILDFLKENKAYFKYRHSFILLFPLQLLSACWQRFWSPGEGTSANDNLSASGSQEQQRSGWCGGGSAPFLLLQQPGWEQSEPSWQGPCLGPPHEIVIWVRIGKNSSRLYAEAVPKACFVEQLQVL